jgi:hypothetical protein
MSDEYNDEAFVTLPCVLRSEMLACLALLCRQMNKQYAWNRAKRFDGWELDVQDGPIKVVHLYLICKSILMLLGYCRYFYREIYTHCTSRLHPQSLVADGAFHLSRVLLYRDG